MNDTYIWIILAVSSILFGYLLFKVLLHFIPRLEAREIKTQQEEVLREALRQKESIIADSITQNKEKETLLLEELEADITSKKEDLQATEDELNSRHTFLETEEKRIQKLEQNLADKYLQIEKMDDQIRSFEFRVLEHKNKTISELERLTELDSTKVTDTLSNNLIEERQLECQKVLKLLQEDISAFARKKAQRILDRTLARYQPQFIWPKPNNVIEVNDPKISEMIISEKCSLITRLSELSQTSISPILSNNRDNELPVIIKIAGGYGIYREAARMTLAELLLKGPQYWSHGEATYKKHREKLENESTKLGNEAVNILKLDHVHLEIQKLVGALNWRTSYRQNQWYHTIEVAILAGILASELGVDPAEAKRVGMLHDIGKAIDYRIEGSHAVISGDYADRYGEHRIICDTVMSHHADLIVETPLAYVLRAADTLSGARPGARVNLEEGYQIRLSAIYDVVNSFPGISDIAIMNGGREVHIQVSHRKVSESQVKELAESIARKIEDEVAFPGQIKVVVSRPFESVIVA